MKISVDSFRGEVPLITPRALPINAAQSAINCRMQTGDLESWRQFLSEKVLANAADVQTIYLLKDKWLSWNDQVDVARSVLPGDTSYRVFLTCPALYATPRFTDYALATTGAEPYPVVTRPLGVPNPTDDMAPTVVVGSDPTPTDFTIDITDTGATYTPTWTVSADVGGPYPSGISHVRNSLVEGMPLPSYELTYRNNVTSPAFLYRTYKPGDFGISAADKVSLTFDFKFGATSAAQALYAHLACETSGAGITVQFGGDFVGGPSNRIGIYKAGGWGVTTLSALTAQIVAPYTPDVVYRAVIEATKDLIDATKREVSVKVYLGADIVHEITATPTEFDIGDVCGFVGEVGYDSTGGDFKAYIDNIRVVATGTTNYDPADLATAYVFTFRNDLGQESGQSPASATALRPDGVSATVTMPTTIPVGSDPTYGITEKVLYRSVTGSGGTLFKEVAVVPLATAVYVDTLLDSQTGPRVLESEDWDLPPPTLEGIRALPNGVMCGWFLNQFCFSVPNRPHAWRVRDRKTTDTDITGAAALDTTVVIGTKSYVYTATGTDPDNYSLSQPGEEQSCVSKLGMVYLDGVGVVFPSPDGYQLCAGQAGSVRNMTGNIFTKRQWEKLNPSSIIAAVHDSVLHWFYDTEPPAPADSALWLDTFTEPNNVTHLYLSEGFEHIQDIRLNDSVWGNDGETASPIIIGNQATYDPELSSQGGARSDFTDGTTVQGLQPGWRFEIDATPLMEAESASDQAQTSMAVFLTLEGHTMLVELQPHHTGGPSTAQIRFVYLTPSAENSFFVEQPAGELKISVLMETDGYTPSLNGTALAKQEFTDIPMSVWRSTVYIGTDFETDDEIPPSGEVSRMAIYGTKAAGPASLFIYIGDVPDREADYISEMAGEGKALDGIIGLTASGAPFISSFGTAVTSHTYSDVDAGTNNALTAVIAGEGAMLANQYGRSGTPSVPVCFEVDVDSSDGVLYVGFYFAAIGGGTNVEKANLAADATTFHGSAWYATDGRSMCQGAGLETGGPVAEVGSKLGVVWYSAGSDAALYVFIDGVLAKVLPVSTALTAANMFVGYLPS